MQYEPRSTLGSFFSQYRQYGFWRVRVLEMHPGALQPRQLVPAVWLVSVALGGLGILAGHRIRLLAVPSVGGYLGLMSVAAIRTAGPQGAGRMLIALATMHVAYGLGVLQGLAAAVSRFNRDTERTKAKR